MSVLTNDISKFGRCLVGEFYDVEVTKLSSDDYRKRFIQAYGEQSTHMMASIEQFESLLWRNKQTADEIRKTIENWPMPDGEYIKEKITERIVGLTQYLIKTGSDLYRSRQVRDGLITVNVTFNFKDNTIFSTRLLHIELTLK